MNVFSSVRIRFRTTCILIPSWRQLVQVGQSWVKLILVSLFCPLVWQEFTKGFTLVLVPGYPEQDILHPFTWINVQGPATVHQGLDDDSTHRSIVPVGVLSSMFTATVSCAECFCLLLRDREGLIGLGKNDPPGIS